MHVGQKIGPFTLERELGSGAMGAVYKANLQQEDGKPDRTVALKVIAFGLSSNDQALARFEREAMILKQLRHPNIVRLLATGRYKGTPFFAMEYVAGQSMDRIMAARSTGGPLRAPFSWEEVVEFGVQLCAALQHAHEKGIIHRDVKPSNLMLTDEGVLKLTDFGIAKDIDVTALTGANNTIGTAAYMSPEQCKGEKVLTGKSDIYSLGVVFYELMTGRKPFIAESSVDMFLMHVNGTFTRPAQLNPEIPIWLDTLVCQMMEKRPEMRPRDAAMVGQVLEEIAAKVAAQRSAGADLAGARAVDRVHLTDVPTKEDIAAAKSIRAGSRKKKLRKKRRPIHTRGWFVSLAALLFVGGAGAGVWYGLLAPPTAESLLKRIETAGTDDAKKAAATDYLKHYADRTDDATEKVKTLDRDLRVAERARVLLKRHGNDNLRAKPAEDDDPEAYQKTMAALTAENVGDTAAARALWTELAHQYAADTDPALVLWGWLAQKKLADLAATGNQVAGLLKRMADEFRLEDKDIKFDDLTESQAAMALRLEQFGDFALANARWGQMAEMLTADAARRPWFVFARQRVHDLETQKQVPKDAKARAEMVAGSLMRSREIVKDKSVVEAQRRNARNVLRDIRDLYSGETGDLGTLVNEAKTLLEQYPG